MFCFCTTNYECFCLIQLWKMLVIWYIIDASSVRHNKGKCRPIHKYSVHAAVKWHKLRHFETVFSVITCYTTALCCVGCRKNSKCNEFFMKAAPCRGSPSSLGKIKHLENERGEKRTKGVFSIFNCSSAAAESLRYSSQPVRQHFNQPCMHTHLSVYLN